MQTRQKNYGAFSPKRPKPVHKSISSDEEVTEDELNDSYEYEKSSSINTSSGSKVSDLNGSGDNEYFIQKESVRRRFDPPPVGWNVRDSFDGGDYIKPKTNKTDSSFWSNPYVVVIVLIIIATVFVYFFGIYSKGISDAISIPHKNCSDLVELSEKFPMHDERFWDLIQVGIEHVQNDEPPEPAVFVFVHSNKKEALNIVNRIVETATVCLGSSGGALTLHLSEFTSKATMKDYGILIEKYKQPLTDKKVMIVHDIHLVPPTVAPVFHVFCDTKTPVVKKSALFFTIKVKEEEIPLDRNELYEFVENRLEELWKSGVDKDKIQPLITRLTDNVLHINMKKS